MKNRTLITISLSIIFTLILTLVLVTVPTTVAFADETAELPIESVNPKSTIETLETPKESVKDHNKKVLSKAREKDKPDKNSVPFIVPSIGGTPQECICDAGGGFIGIKVSPRKCACRDFCNPGRTCPLP